MSTTLQSRIDALARRDRLLAVIFAVCMWVAILFVLFMAAAVAPTAGIVVAIALSALLLGLINTASMVALVRRYAANKDLVYRPDIENLDHMHRERAAGRS